MKKSHVAALTCVAVFVGSLIPPAAADRHRKPRCQGKVATIVGTNGKDRIRGTNRADVIVAKGGDDSVTGRGGRDTICGNGGDDTLNGSGADDTLNGSGGADDLYGRAGDDVLDGGPGGDFVSYELAASGVQVDLDTGMSSGGDGSDALVNVESVVGSNFDDTLGGDENQNAIWGLEGNDDIATLDESDYINPGLGNDNVDGGTDPLTPDDLTTVGDTVDYLEAPAAITVDLGAGTVSGGSGSDTLARVEFVAGTDFADTLVGSDTPNEGFAGEGGDDIIDGRGGGLDTVDYSFSSTPIVANLATGEATGDYDGTDTLIGIEWLIGTAFNDLLIGDHDDEVFEGRDGDDEIRAGAGADRVDGGGGSDVCQEGETVVNCEG